MDALRSTAPSMIMDSPAPTRTTAFTAAEKPASEPQDSFFPECTLDEPKEVQGDLFKSDFHYMWGFKGHSMINSGAAHDLPADMPEFFREAREQLSVLASQPDKWKFRSLSQLNAVNRPDHWINGEQLGTHELPSDRYQYLGLIINDGLQRPDKEPAKIGFLPYAIAEQLEKLTAEMALWRREVHMNGEDTPTARQLAQNIIYTAGVMGHFVADASQPLHTTVHGNGWDPTWEPNEEGFSTDPGIHSRFESRYVNAAVSYNALPKLLHPAQVLQGDSLTLARDYINETHSHVRELYRLDRDNQLNPERPTAEGTEFATARLISGAQKLRDLWYTAWTRSEKLSLEVEDPFFMRAPETTDDAYLLAR